MMILPSLTIAEAAALLLWLAQKCNYETREDLIDSAEACAGHATVSNLCAHARYHLNMGGRRPTCAIEGYRRAAAYALLAAARGLG